MKKYCSRNSLNCFDFIPISFVFDFDDVTKYEAEMKRFVFYYCENMMNPEMRGRK